MRSWSVMETEQRNRVSPLFGPFGRGPIIEVHPGSLISDQMRSKLYTGHASRTHNVILEGVNVHLRFFGDCRDASSFN